MGKITSQSKGAANESATVSPVDIKPDIPPLVIPSLLARTASMSEGPCDDIGIHATLIKEAPPTPPTVKSEKTRILEDIYENVGSHQVSRGKLDNAPPWILDQSFDKEITSNWIDTIDVVHERSVPKTANVISSHCVYKIKTQEDGCRSLKSRIVPHGNRDD